MRQFKEVLKFEYTSYIKSKMFIAITAFLLILIIAAVNVPNFANIIDSISSDETKSSDNETPGSQSGTKGKKAAIYDPQGDYPVDLLKAYYPGYDWVVLETLNESAIENDITSDTYSFVLAIDQLNYTVYQKGSDSMLGSISGVYDMVLSTYQNKVFSSFGLTDEQIVEFRSAVPSGSNVYFGKDLQKSFWIGYVMLMVLYMAILMYSQYVVSSVISEKSSKTMELLITSVRPVYLMFGKVIGSGLAGLTQLAAIILAVVATYSLTSEQWLEFAPGIASLLTFSSTIGIMLYALLFFVLGYFIFAFLYAAFASTVSRMEDANKVVMVPMMLFIAAFLVAMSGTMSNPDSTFNIVCSFVPFLSPLVMFTRICVSEVALYQILIAVVINVVSIIAAGIVSAKIYRVGVLMYGKPMKMLELIKQIIRA